MPSILFDKICSKRNFLSKSLTLLMGFILLCSSIPISKASAGGITQGGANSYEDEDGNLHLYDTWLMVGTSPLKLKEEKLWQPLQEMLDYLDTVIPLFPFTQVNDEFGQNISWSEHYWNFPMFTSILKSLKVRKLRYNSFNEKDAKTILNNYFFPSLGSKLRDSIKMRTWYKEDKPLTTKGCWNISLTEDKNRKVAACQDDYEVRISSELLQRTEHDPKLQASFVLHELFRILLKPVVSRIENSGSRFGTQKLTLESYGNEVLDKLVAKLVNLTVNKSSRKEFKKTFETYLKIEAFWMNDNSINEIKNLYFLLNKNICSAFSNLNNEQDNTLLTTNFVGEINQTLLTELNKKLKSYDLTLEGSFFNDKEGSPVLTGSIESYKKFLKFYGSNNFVIPDFVYSGAEFPIKQSSSNIHSWIYALINNPFNSHNETKFKISVGIPIIAVWHSKIADALVSDSKKSAEAIQVIKNTCQDFENFGIMEF